MNSDTVAQFLKRGFHITLGATASLVELLQDPNRRDANLVKMRQEFQELAEIWATKGEVTEREARTYVDTLMEERRNAAANMPKTVNTTATTIEPNTKEDSQLELQELTAQLSAMRAEIEQLRNRKR